MNSAPLSRSKRSESGTWSGAEFMFDKSGLGRELFAGKPAPTGWHLDALVSRIHE